jgi:hypothetical protein
MSVGQGRPRGQLTWSTGPTGPSGQWHKLWGPRPRRTAPEQRRRARTRRRLAGSSPEFTEKSLRGTFRCGTWRVRKRLTSRVQRRRSRGRRWPELAGSSTADGGGVRPSSGAMPWGMAGRSASAGGSVAKHEARPRAQGRAEVAVVMAAKQAAAANVGPGGEAWGASYGEAELKRRGGTRSWSSPGPAGAQKRLGGGGDRRRQRRRSMEGIGSRRRRRGSHGSN